MFKHSCTTLHCARRGRQAEKLWQDQTESSGLACRGPYYSVFFFTLVVRSKP